MHIFTGLLVIQSRYDSYCPQISRHWLVHQNMVLEIVQIGAFSSKMRINLLRHTLMRQTLRGTCTV